MTGSFSSSRRSFFTKGALLGVASSLWPQQSEAAANALQTIAPSDAPSQPSPLVELQERAFFLGREYFVLRSGRSKLIVQADRADLGPAVTWLLFDAEQPQQSARKNRAFNFVGDDGFANSALTVKLGDFSFTALGHRTDTNWVVEDGIPAVEAVWWAGGVRITERIAAIGNSGIFRRRIRLDAANLTGPDRVMLALNLPAEAVQADDGLVFQERRGAHMALLLTTDQPRRTDVSQGRLEIGPVELSPGQTHVIDTFLVTQVPASNQATFAAQVRALRGTDSRALIAETGARWRSTSSITAQDLPVRELFDKARFGLQGMVADDGTIDAGIFEYGQQWVRDTSNTTVGLLHAGHFELAHGTVTRLLTSMVSTNGVTMVEGKFAEPDVEEHDQMGVLLHALRQYRDWTGDEAPIREHREMLLRLIERPLDARFRDDSGMVHGRREYWERTFDDAYELAYQTYIVLGLREAIELAPLLGATDRVPRWRSEAERIHQAMLSHPAKALVHDGHLIKRRSVSGEIVEFVVNPPGYYADAPTKVEQNHRLMPDASMALPIILGVVDPHSELARRTLDELEGLYNARWSDGGYDRYNTSSSPDQPGPWPFATAFILRAQHDAGMWERSRKTLEWLNQVQGGRAGAWFEEIPCSRLIQSRCALIPWTSAEMAVFVVQHYLGIRFERGQVVIRPALYPGKGAVVADLRFRTGRLGLKVTSSGRARAARLDGKAVPIGDDGSIRLPAAFAGGNVEVECV